MARFYFEKPFNFVANKRGDTLSYKADKTYTVTTPCAEAAEKAGVGRRVDQKSTQSADIASKTPQNTQLEASDTVSTEKPTDTGQIRKTAPRERSGGLDGFIRRVPK